MKRNNIKRLKNVKIPCECGRQYMKAYNKHIQATGNVDCILKCDNCGRKITVFRCNVNNEKEGE